jgi:hypothetical protein
MYLLFAMYALSDDFSSGNPTTPTKMDTRASEKNIEFGLEKLRLVESPVSVNDSNIFDLPQ